MIYPTHFNAFRLNAEATFYSSTGICANGRTPSENRRRYGLCAACNRGRLGDRALVSRSGVRVLVTITDRIGHGSSIDLRPEAARILMGRKYRVIGRMSVRLRVLQSHQRRLSSK